MQANAINEQALTREERQTMIEQIRDFPPLLEAALAGLSEADVYTAHLPGEWTVAQNVHHLADVAQNTFIRMKLMLTEDTPLLKPYDQDVWAQTEDAKDAPLEPSLWVIKGAHERWYRLLHSALDRDWSQVTGQHMELGEVNLDDLVRYYSAHGEGHIEQINKTLAARTS